MKCYMAKVRLVLVVCILLGFAGPGFAQQPVPFLGTLSGDVTVTPLAPPFVYVYVKATGNSTHLGLFQLAIPHTVDRSNFTATGTYEFVAANGDKLIANFIGKSGPTATPGVLAIEEIAVIDSTKSTGRFIGSTGAFTSRRLFNTITGKTIGSFQGTITSPGLGTP